MKYLRLVTLPRLPIRFWSDCFFAGLLAATLSGCVDLSGSSGSLTSSQQAGAPESAPPADAGLLLLLVPDDQVLSNPMVTAWVDAGSEIGVRIQAVTDRQFMALGIDALKYAGLILPDRLHVIADDGLLKSIREYTQDGGQTLLVYDFGTMTLNSNSKPIFSIPKARLSDLAGVDYALYDSLREKSIVVGTVAAMRSTLRELQVPPGKSSPYLLPKNPTTGLATPATRPAFWVKAVETPGVYVPESSAALLRNKDASTVAGAADVLESYSGYLLGNLMYPSFVTQGSFNGGVLATSAEAGLLAGLNKVGRGQVLFVNLPLTELKVTRTDGLPMHGFLRYFAHNMLQMAQLSPVPDAVAGLTLNSNSH